MTPTDPTATFSLGTFILLRDVIHDRLGVWFDEDKRDLLAGKLSDRVAALSLRSFRDYYFRLKYSPDSEDEWRHLTEALSVQETYLWREIDQIRTLVDVLLPQHLATNRGPIRIWSAACATGEEPLTLAIALNEAGWFERTSIEVLASDVSPAALKKAERGVYRERSFRALPSDLRAKYFTRVADGWQVDSSLKSRVSFRRANLLEGADTAVFETARYIFCRNVFIYFSPEAITQVVDRFAQRMPTPGYLFVGVSESLLRRTRSFELEQIDGTFVYVKGR